MEYLFDKWNYIKKILEGKYLLIFFDFDGTLVPIAETPDKAVIPKRTKELLEKLSRTADCKVVIISGRKVKDIKNKIQLKNIIYSGNHGLEIKGPGIKFKTPCSQRYKNILKNIKKELTEKLSIIEEILFEDKKYSLSIHYRLINKKDVSLVKTIVDRTISPYEAGKEIKIKQGKKVFEIMPPIEWDKGKAVLWILGKQQKSLKKKNVFPIYLGDDITDEDAFNVLRNKGVTVFVGRPQISKARYYLKNSSEVAKTLKHILEIRE